MTNRTATHALTSVCSAVLLAVSGSATADTSDFYYEGTITDGTPLYASNSPLRAYRLGSQNGSFTFNVKWDYSGTALYGYPGDFQAQYCETVEGNAYSIKDITLNSSGTIHVSNTNVYQIQETLFAKHGATYNVDSYTAVIDITGTDERAAGGSAVEVNSTALNAMYGTTVNLGDVSIKSTVNVENPETLQVVNNGIYASGEGVTVNLNGNVYINTILSEGLEEAYESGYGPGLSKNDALSGKRGGTINVNQAGGKTVQLLGNLDVKGSSSSVLGTINLRMDTADSYWYGHAANLSEKSLLNVSISNGAFWIPDLAVEAMQNLELKDGGIVNLHGLNLHTSKAGVTQQLGISNLTGTGGIFVMDLDASNASGPVTDEPVYTGGEGYDEATGERDHEGVPNHNDFLYVKSGSGTFKLQPADASKFAGASYDNPVWFADAAEGVAFEADAGKSDLAAGTVYDYTLMIDTDVKDSDKNTNGTNWYVVGLKADPTPAADTVISDASLSYAAATSLLALESLNKRLGEIRSYGAGHTGVWVRAKAGRLSSNKNGSFRDTYQFYQLGADYAYRPANSDGTFLFGGAIHTSNSDSKFASGSGDLDTVGGSVYASWYGDSGWYADLIGKYSHLDDDYTVSSNGQSAKASYSSDAWSLSIEGGRRFENKGWVFEPEAQLIYTYVGCADYRLSNGVRVSQDSADSIIGRAGFRLGHDFKFAENLKNSKAYVKADLYHEFMGDRTVVVTGNDAVLRRDTDGSDTWLSFGLGADFSITERLYAYADFEKSVAGDVKTQWQVNAGVRYAF